MFYLCRRGRENLRTMKKSDFALKVDEKGKYIEKVSDELTKNRRENDKEKKKKLSFMQQEKNHVPSNRSRNTFRC